MSDSTPKFKREPAEHRREALIKATLSLIAEKGVQAATVRAIAARADVSQGMIRHHFSSKEDLITAAYEHHMDRLTDLTSAFAGADCNAPVARLAAFVVGSLTPPVVDAGSVSLWAGFLTKVHDDAQMRESHKRTYYNFRNRLEALIVAVLNEAGKPRTTQELRHLAIACNAVIDGLWMEGGVLPSAFAPDELAEIGIRSVGALLGIDLTKAGQQT
ncbi:TetR family transcriptional regulator C-terminal domain-containing protein [Sulfitobacter sp. NFXS29]|uniref:TetR/AcrR family transcriptional regulator n=1 Tax=Sulfitobacter sp. NFXS29 TaxID=2818438 RepID=UPI0032DF2811